MKALIVDDSSTIRAVVEKMLKAMGHTVEFAKDGREGFEALMSAKKFDFVLLDWNMPNMTGPELLDALRAKGFNGCPIIMMTTENSMEHIQTALQKGASEYIMKPFSEDILKEKISYVTTSSGAA